MSAMTRRAAIGLAVGTVAVALPSVALVRGPSAWDRARSNYRDATQSLEALGRNHTDEQIDATADVWAEARRALMNMPAPDLDGVQIKVRVLGALSNEQNEAILADLVRMCGREVFP